MKPSIVVVGSSNTDMVIKIPRLPKPGETILGGSFSMAAGGKGANQAVAAARAGGAVTLVARVGHDVFGKEAKNDFERDGINTEFVSADSELPTGVALIFVDERGENSIAVASGANAALTPPELANAKEAITSADALLLQLEVPLTTVAAAARLAAGAGVRVILNPAPARPLDEDLLKLVSVITPNETEAELLTGVRVSDDRSAAEASDLLLAKGIPTVVITLGSRGAYVAARNHRELLPAFNVRPVDATAAGDVFNGALAVALAEKRNLHDAVRFAQAAAAICVTKLGAQSSVPFRTDIEGFLRKTSTRLTAGSVRQPDDGGEEILQR
jgi:ribokinase